MAFGQPRLCFLLIVCLEVFVITRISFAQVNNAHFENVARNKLCSQSSTWSSSNGADQAVDGNDNTYSHTARGDTNPSWTVDLGRAYPIYALRSDLTRLTASRMSNVKVTVDGMDCYTYPSDVSTSQTAFSCTGGVRNGRIVSLNKPFDSIASQSDNLYLHIAEFFVFSCKEDYWGPVCNGVCGQCSGGTCDKVTGACAKCLPGWKAGPSNLCVNACDDYTYGQDCGNLCNANCLGVCDKVSGSCSCKPGWQSSTCNQECNDYFFGQNCAFRCNTNCQDVCNKVDGSCTCTPGWRPPDCNQVCPYGRYGQDCLKHCSVHCTDICGGGNCIDNCDRVTGSCTCEPGYQTPNCTTECPAGTYGDRCLYSCSDNCVDGLCNNVNGHCTCKPGYKGVRCDQTCSPGFYGAQCLERCGRCAPGTTCDHVTGFCSSCSNYFTPPTCKECLDNVWGVNCNVNCSTQCTDVCDKTTGFCTCTIGYQPPSCLTVCDAGYYGDQCSLRCGNCSSGDPCRRYDGHCLGGCQSFLAPPFCQAALQVIGGGGDGGGESSGSGAAVGAGVGAAVVVIGVGVAVAVFIVIRRRKQRSKGNEQQETGPSSASRGNDNFSSVTTDNIYQNVSLVDQRPPTKGPSDGPEQNEQGHAATKPKPNPKPKVAVKPIVTIAAKQGAAAGSETVYNNVVLATPTSNSGGAKASEVPDNEDGEEEAGCGDVYYNDDTYMTSEGAELALDSVQQALVDRLRGQTLDAEFKKLVTGLIRACTAGEDQENYYKNRFTSILPYDDNRVVLRDAPHKGANDYINASYVRGWDTEKAYIAAQGPRHNTMEDMWWMVWQEQITHIVMLTTTHEKEKKKCEKYWPGPSKRRDFGDVSVTGVEEQVRADYVIRTFQVKGKDSRASRSVVQFHYVAWPDHGVPKVASLVDFWCSVSLTHRNSGSTEPLLVHCSAGVGRTGTFIALDSLMRQADLGSGDLDVYDTATKLRQDRCFMIQTKSQYRLLHEAVLEAYTCRKCRAAATSLNTLLPSEVDPAKANSYIDTEFQKLRQMQLLQTKSRYREAERPENINKNRDPSCLPDDAHLVYLTHHIKGRNQYINAVYAPTFFNRRGCIMTQLPLQETIIDFWRLVAGNDVTTVFSIGAESESDDKYWPREKNQTLTFGPFGITLTSHVERGPCLTSYTLSVTTEDQTTEASVHYYSGWGKELLPDESADFSQLLGLVTESDSPELFSAPVILQCRDGACRSGMTRAMADVLNRMAHDGQVDVFTAVKQTRLIRPQAVASPVLYRYIYHMVQRNAESDNIYQNV